MSQEYSSCDYLHLCCVSRVTTRICVSWYHWNYLLLSGPHGGAHTNTIDAMWTHIKVHLSADNWKAHYIFCLAEYMFEGCVPFAPHRPHLHVNLLWELGVVCSVGTVVTTDHRGGHSILYTVLLALILASYLSRRLLPLLAPPTTATWKALCLFSTEDFPAMVGLCYSRANIL